MLRTRMTARVVIRSELFFLDSFRYNFVSARSLVYYYDTFQLCRTGPGDVSHA